MDPDVGTDVALSFQESNGCTQIWNTIQGMHSGTEDLLAAQGTLMDDGGVSASLPKLGDGGPLQAGPAVELPWPEPGNLGDIAKALSDLSYIQKERMTTQLHRDSCAAHAVACMTCMYNRQHTWRPTGRISQWQ